MIILYMCHGQVAWNGHKISHHHERDFLHNVYNPCTWIDYSSLWWEHNPSFDLWYPGISGCPVVWVWTETTLLNGLGHQVAQFSDQFLVGFPTAWQLLTLPQDWSTGFSDGHAEFEEIKHLSCSKPQNTVYKNDFQPFLYRMFFCKIL